MRREGLNLGGEQSGHIVLLDHTTTGDGLITTLQVLRVMVEMQKPLSELGAAFTQVPQVLEAVQVRTKPPLETVPGIVAAVKSVRGALEGKGRVLVRYSGTEKKCRVMVEGDDLTEIQGYVDELVSVITREIGHE
jgi:phosphoglucosamine mutase